ncbi:MULTISPECIES: kinase [Luteimonas]|uniref:kinase n=1 Tax=Luteimonas TaxID=83614 RepID=UPI00117EB798|nr:MULTISPECIES: kinase [Luteimonas]
MPPAPAPRWSDALVASLLDDIDASGARCFGISGLQGTGKSTLAAQLCDAATRRGRRVAILSLDDLYLDRDARRILARDVHPLLATRGPPGTHEVASGIDVLDALRAGQRVALPRFDKLGDRRLPAARWPVVESTDLVLFEGWCVGVRAEPDTALAAPVNALERDEDADGRWRRWCNAALAAAYPALWQRIDRLLFLQPPEFAVVAGWRWEQELALQRAEPGRAGMDRAQVARFVQHYERVSRQALRTLPDMADRVVRLDAHRRPLGD